jgi:hypothetical protein
LSAVRSSKACSWTNVISFLSISLVCSEGKLARNLMRRRVTKMKAMAPWNLKSNFKGLRELTFFRYDNYSYDWASLHSISQAFFLLNIFYVRSSERRIGVTNRYLSLVRPCRRVASITVTLLFPMLLNQIFKLGMKEKNWKIDERTSLMYERRKWLSSVHKVDCHPMKTKQNKRKNDAKRHSNPLKRGNLQVEKLWQGWQDTSLQCWYETVIHDPDDGESGGTKTSLIKCSKKNPKKWELYQESRWERKPWPQ